jgi:tight adherence protein B
MTWLPLLAFVAIAGTIFFGYLAVTHLPGMLAGRRLEQRLRDASFGGEAGADGDSTIVKQKEGGPLPALDKIVGQTRAGSWLSRLIEKSGVKTTPSAVVTVSLSSAASGGLIAVLFTGKWWAGALAAITGALMPILFLLHKRGARLKRFEEQFPEALDLLSRAIRAGHAFQTAMGMVADELTEPVGPEFKKTFDQQNFGLPLREALNELSERINILDVRFFVTAVLIQRDTGGNLAEILDNLAHVVRERFKIRRQIRVHTAHGRFTGYVLLALPAALGIALSFINADHMNLLFRERMGQMMLIGAIIMQSIGFFWIRQIVKIEV